MDSINLMPKFLLDQQRGELRRRLMIRLTFALVIVVASIWLALAIAYIFSQDLAVDSGAPNSQEIIRLSHQIKIAEEELKHARRGVEARLGHVREKLSVIGVIDTIAGAVPTGVTLGSVRISRGGVSLKGVARDRGAVSEMVNKIGVSLNETPIIIEKLSDVAVDRDIYQEFLVSQKSQK